MTRRQRKFVGAIVMLVFVVVYALGMMALAEPMLAGASKLGQAVFYAVAGLAWAPPLMLLVSWMEKLDRPRDA